MLVIHPTWTISFEEVMHFAMPLVLAAGRGDVVECVELMWRARLSLCTACVPSEFRMTEGCCGYLQSLPVAEASKMSVYKESQFIYMLLSAISVQKVARRLFQMDKKMTCHTAMEIMTKYSNLFPSSYLDGTRVENSTPVVRTLVELYRTLLRENEVSMYNTVAQDDPSCDRALVTMECVRKDMRRESGVKPVHKRINQIIAQTNPNVFSMIRDLPKTTSDIGVLSGFVDKNKESLEKLVNAGAGITDMVESMKNDPISFFSSLFNVSMEKLKPMLPILLPLFGLGIAVYWLRRRSCDDDCEEGVSALETLGVLAATVGGGALIGQMLTVFKNETVESQAGGPLKELINIFVAGYGLVFSCKTTVVEKLLDVFKKPVKVGEAIVEILESLKEVWNVFKEHVLHWDVEIEFSGFRDYDDLIRETNALVVEGDRIYITHKLISDLKDMIDSGEKLRIKYAKNTAMCSGLTMALEKLKKLRKHCVEVYSPGAGDRLEAMCLFLWGPPGTGKSTAAQLFADRWCKHQFMDNEHKMSAYADDPNIFIHKRVEGSQYFDGIHRKCEVLLYTDFCAARSDVNASYKPELELIQFVDATDVPVNIAACEGKGVLRPAPTAVICATNLTKFPGENIRATYAACRRVMPLMFKQIYQDVGKMAPPVGAIDPSQWRFIASEATQIGFREKTIQPLTFDEVFQMMVERHNELIDKHVSMGSLFATNTEFINSIKTKDDILKAIQEKTHRRELLRFVRENGEHYDSEVQGHFYDGGSVIQQAVPIRRPRTLEQMAALGNWQECWYFVRKHDVSINNWPLPMIEEWRTWLIDNDEQVHNGVSSSIAWRTKIELRNGFLRKKTAIVQNAPTTLQMSAYHFEFNPVIWALCVLKDDAQLNDQPIAVKEAMVRFRAAQSELGPVGSCNMVWKLLKVNKDLERLALEEAFGAPLPYETAVWIDPEMWKTVTDYVEEYGPYLRSKAYQFLKDCGDMLYYACAVGISCSVLYGIMRFMFPAPQRKKKQVHYDEQAQYTPIPGARPTRPVSRLRPTPGPIIAQAVNDAPVIAVIKDHVYVMRVAGTLLSSAIALGDRDFLINHHAAEDIRNTVETCGYDFEIDFENRLRKFTVHSRNFKKDVCVDDEERDFCFFKVPDVQPHTSIVNQFVTSTFVADVMADYKRAFWMRIVPQYDAHPTSPSKACGVTHYMSGFKGKVVRRISGVRSVYPNYVGMCGALGFVHDGPVSEIGKIFGFHSAGRVGQGPQDSFCTLLSRDDLKRYLGRLNGVPEPQRSDGVVPIGEASIANSMWTKGNLVLLPSLYPMKQPTKAVAQVNDVENYIKARAKYNKNIGLIISPEDREIYQACVVSVFDTLFDKARYPMRAGLCDLKSVIFGEKDTELKGINLQTSAGYPNAAQGIKKHRLIGRFIDGVFETGDMSEEMRQSVDEAIEKIRNGCLHLGSQTNVVKYELLNAQKAENGKVRVVHGVATLRHLITMVLFGNFVEFLMANHNQNGCALGHNMLGEDADYMAERHLGMSCGEDLTTAGDYSGFDGSLTDPILDPILRELCKRCCVEDSLEERVRNLEMRENFCMSYFRTVHIRGKEVEFMENGLSSGDSLTSPINCIVNLANIRFAACKTAGTIGILADFDQNVEPDVLGDDHIFTTSPEWRNVLNGKSMEKFMPLIGYNYTNEKKEGEILAHRSFFDCEFLKRKCEFEPVLNRYVARLDLDTVLEIPLWTRALGQNYAPSIAQAVQNADTCVRELCFHSDEVWDEWLPKLEKMFYQYEWRPISRSRKVCLERFWDVYDPEIFHMEL